MGERMSSVVHLPVKSYPDPFSELQPHRHKAIDLSREIVKWLKGLKGQWDRAQGPRQTLIALLWKTRDHDRDLDIVELQAFYSAFSNFLFGGPLAEYVRLNLKEVIEWEGKPQQGLTYSEQLQDGSVVIVIDILDRSKLGEIAEVRRRRILEVLLHEMLHSLFFIYQCQCKECRTDEMLYTTTGFTWHGPAWVSLADAVEEVFCYFKPLAMIMEGNEVRVGIEESVDVERDSDKTRKFLEANYTHSIHNREE